jgi:hypothetical protein
MVDESLQEWRYVAGYGLRIGVVAVAQRCKNLTYSAGLGKHPPNLAGYGIEAKIGASAQTQKHRATVEVSSYRLAISNKNAFDRDAQGR